MFEPPGIMVFVYVVGTIARQLNRTDPPARMVCTRLMIEELPAMILNYRRLWRSLPRIELCCSNEDLFASKAFDMDTIG